MTAPLFSRRFRTALCVGMLVFSLALRLLLAPEAVSAIEDALVRAASSDALEQAVLFFETGTRTDGSAAQPQQTAASPTESLTEAPTETAAAQITPVFAPVSAPTEAPGLDFAPSEADAITIRGNSSYTVDKQALLCDPLLWTAEQDAPLVLIVHTHTSEAYTPTEGYGYTPTADYRTLDETRNMLAVGDALAEALTARGIGVIHDRSCNDYPDYNSSYSNAKARIESQLAEYPSIVMVLDVHRDAAAQPVREAAAINGEDCAKLMFVVGTDEGGLYHPYWQENLSCALKLQALLNRTAPGLCRALDLRKERFNGQTSPASFIVEVGSTGNTLPEALRSMPYLAKAVTELLKAQMER